MNLHRFLARPLVIAGTGLLVLTTMATGQALQRGNTTRAVPQISIN
jgi:hypothetical protein